jgi:hypothetical protein
MNSAVMTAAAFSAVFSFTLSRPGWKFMLLFNTPDFIMG